MNSRTLRLLLLAMLMVLAQAGAATHARTHLDEKPKGGTPGSACEWCTAYGHLGDAAPIAAAPEITPAPGLVPRPASQARCILLALRLAYRSQAPPRLS